MSQKDLFSHGSNNYSKYRPSYPDSLFAYLATLTQDHRAAWDCATGNGQAAHALTPYFDKIWATDLSEKQLEQAVVHPKIQYQRGTAEASGLDSLSVDLVTVAQAFHWFDHDAFANELFRVVRPGGVLAVWCYGLARITPEIDAVVLHLYEDVLGPYWEKERRMIEQGYAGIEMPFPTEKAPSLQMNANWSYEHLLGYLGTWSALHTYQKKEGKDPLPTTAKDLHKVWGNDQTKKIEWDLRLRIWRLPR